MSILKQYLNKNQKSTGETRKRLKNKAKNRLPVFFDKRFSIFLYYKIDCVKMGDNGFCTCKLPVNVLVLLKII